MADVARRAGFSRTTVSYVLNGRSDVTIPEPTRARILLAAEELGYRRNGIARSLVRNRTQTLGVVVPSLQSSFHAEIVNGIQEVCSRNEFRMLLAYSLDDPRGELEQVRLLLENRIEGLINVGSWRTQDCSGEILGEVLAEGVPCIVVDDCPAGGLVDCVISDDRNGTAAAMRHLLERGHRRIGHLSGGTRAVPARLREEGYREALAAAGILFDPALVIGWSFSSPDAAQWMEQLLRLPEPPQAVFAANDRLAAEAVVAIRENGLRVPNDVAVVGYGEQPEARYLGLTTVDQAPREMGVRAAERLFARIAEPELPPETIVIPTRLVVRQSCGLSE